MMSDEFINPVSKFLIKELTTYNEPEPQNTDEFSDEFLRDWARWLHLYPIEIRTAPLSCYILSVLKTQVVYNSRWYEVCDIVISDCRIVVKAPTVRSIVFRRGTWMLHEFDAADPEYPINVVSFVKKVAVNVWRAYNVQHRRDSNYISKIRRYDITQC